MKGVLSRRLRDPLFWGDVLQLFKTALAAVVAWVLADAVLELSQPFLAPWTALLVVHATVYSTFSEGARQVAATVIAVLLAAGVGHAFGLDTAAVGVLIVAGLVLGSLPWFGTETTLIATTGLVVLTTGFTDDALLLERLAGTGIGVGVGLLVNLVVWPPLLRRTAITAMNRIYEGIGELLADLAAGLEERSTNADTDWWVDRTRDLDAELDRAWALVRQARESAWMNPRRTAGEFRDPKQWHASLRQMEQAVAESRSMAQTLWAGSNPRQEPDPAFAEEWTSLLMATGQVIGGSDADEFRGVRQRLDTLVGELDSGGRPSPRWPVHGALIVNLRNILDAMDDVAVAHPFAEPPRPLAGLRGVRRQD